MSKFTEGPWNKRGLAILSQRGVIARLPVPQDGGVFDCQDNARLIAAAPDLYEALKSVFPLIQDEIKRGGGIFSDGDAEAIEAALAKADGGKA